MSNVRGFVCSYTNCKSSQKNKKPGISFFSFPNDIKRCKQWIENSGREDLLTKDSHVLHKYYKICSMHFKDIMFVNDLKNRLHSHAVPIPFILHDPHISSRKSPDTKCAEILLNESYNLLKSIMQNKRRTAEEDECDIFGALLAKKLRKFNEIDREIVINVIDNLVFEKLLAKHS